MTALTGATLAEAGIDAVALKPAEMEVARGTELSVSTLTVDYEGREHVPDPETLREMAADHEVRVTAPVRADGYDPRGDDSLLRAVPDTVGLVVVAGNPAYLDSRETTRAIAPRLGEVVSRAADPWVGTERVERLALAAGGTQYELLTGATEHDIRGLRAAGFSGDVAVYAPTVLTGNEDAVLDAIGAYAARRSAVRSALPTGAATDSTATGEAREILLDGCREFALYGSVDEVAARVQALREAGVDRVVGYPARGLDPFLD
ncbi:MULTISPECIES: DUF7388 family protein [Salinibaculum]|uniref:DUF7388 family protein n=1 Tax=Salinibaculum TaxID=2732368 RepID=UPI0030D42F78